MKCVFDPKFQQFQRTHFRLVSTHISTKFQQISTNNFITHISRTISNKYQNNQQPIQSGLFQSTGPPWGCPLPLVTGRWCLPWVMGGLFFVNLGIFFQIIDNIFVISFSSRSLACCFVLLTLITTKIFIRKLSTTKLLLKFCVPKVST